MASAEKEFRSIDSRTTWGADEAGECKSSQTTRSTTERVRLFFIAGDPSPPITPNRGEEDDDGSEVTISLESHMQSYVRASLLVCFASKTSRNGRGRAERLKAPRGRAAGSCGGTNPARAGPDSRPRRAHSHARPSAKGTRQPSEWIVRTLDGKPIEMGTRRRRRRGEEWWWSMRFRLLNTTKSIPQQS